MLKPIAEDTYSWTSPFEGFALRSYYNKHFINLFGRRIFHARDFQKKLEGHSTRPEIMLIGNMVEDRTRMLSICRRLEIETIHSEDGFFPHYTTVHVDPLGFCWESSLPLMQFKKITAKQREYSREVRDRWLAAAAQSMDHRIRHQFVLWPLQLIKDRVNRCGLNVNRWDTLIAHFRRCLPTEFQIVIKPHPRGDVFDSVGISELSRFLPNVLLLQGDHPLRPLLQSCAGVAGVNSSVLYEARLMFRKPTYVYGQGWFTNHEELFIPIDPSETREPTQIDQLSNKAKRYSDYHEEYTDWFLYQLLVRQINREFVSNKFLFKKRIFQMSFSSYKQYGEEIFD